MKFLSDDAIAYMDQVWGFSGATDTCDTQAFWDEGFPELVALRFVNGGAVEPNCKEAKEMIRVANSIGPRTEQRLIDEALNEYSIQECNECNAVNFFRNEYQAVEFCYSCAHSKGLQEPKRWIDLYPVKKRKA